MWLSDRQTPDKVISVSRYASQATQKNLNLCRTSKRFALRLIQTYYLNLKPEELKIPITTKLQRGWRQWKWNIYCNTSVSNDTQLENHWWGVFIPVINKAEGYSKEHVANTKYDREFHLERIGHCDLVGCECPNLKKKLYNTIFKNHFLTKFLWKLFRIYKWKSATYL